MKEVMAVIRLNKVNQTKKALAEAGFPSFTCRRVLGRGKKPLDFELIQGCISLSEFQPSPMAENLSERDRLIPKRLFTLIVNDEEVKKVVDILINANSTSTPGDGKIFILSVEEVYRVRDEIKGKEAI